MVRRVLIGVILYTGVCLGARAQAAGDTSLSSRQGALRLDGRPFFPILTWAQCADAMRHIHTLFGDHIRANS